MDDELVRDCFEAVDETPTCGTCEHSNEYGSCEYSDVCVTYKCFKPKKIKHPEALEADKNFKELEPKESRADGIAPLEEVLRVLGKTSCEKCGEKYRYDPGSAVLGIGVLVCGCSQRKTKLTHGFMGQCNHCKESAHTRASTKPLFCPCCAHPVAQICKTCKKDEGYCTVNDPEAGKTQPCVHWEKKLDHGDMVRLDP